MMITRIERWRRMGEIREQVRLLLLTPRDTPEKKAARRARCLRRQKEILRQHYRAALQYTDRTFLERYARKYTAKLLKDRQRIIQQHLKFSRRRALIEHLASHAPELLAWSCWQVTALEIAERLAVEPPPPPPPRRMRTADEVRAKILRRLEVKKRDAIARTKLTLDLMKEARASLDEYELDEDERQRVEHELIEDILSDHEDSGNRNSKIL